MPGFHTQLEEQTLLNQNFRKVLFTGKHSQLVLMTLAPSEEIGLETHPDNDQFFRFESGEGKVVIDGQEYVVVAGDGIVVVAGSEHNVINTSPINPLKLYTIYSPSHHPDQTVHPTKKEALAAEASE